MECVRGGNRLKKLFIEHSMNHFLKGSVLLHISRPLWGNVWELAFLILSCISQSQRVKACCSECPAFLMSAPSEMET